MAAAEARSGEATEGVGGALVSDDELADRLILAVLEAHDGAELWRDAKYDPAKFRQAMKWTLEKAGLLALSIAASKFAEADRAVDAIKCSHCDQSRGSPCAQHAGLWRTWAKARNTLMDTASPRDEDGNRR